MAENQQHKELVEELSKQLKTLFENSDQAIYLYLDDTHKACNKKFSDLLGYKSPEDWQKNEYPVDDVAEEDQENTINAYMLASKKYHASTIRASVKKKDGSKVKTEVMFTPITYKGETFVLHFLTPINK